MAGPAVDPEPGLGEAPAGLSSEEAFRRLASTRQETDREARFPSWLYVLGRQFTSRLILLLVLATAASVLLGEWLNAAAIGVTVVASTAFGFANEYRSERAIAALKRLTAQRASVVRDGLHQDIPADAVVVGDLLSLTEGDIIAADGRVLESRGLSVNEAILTGEPEAVLKEAPRPSAATGDAVFAGTTVVAGSGHAIVTGAGGDTELGSVRRAVASTRRRPTPLETNLARLGNKLLLAFLLLCTALAVLGLAQGRDSEEVLEMAVSLAIGAVPEGLPAVATASLAIAVHKLARAHVLVRRLDAVETLGSTTVIVTDKTGTLTENRMTVRELTLPSGRRLEVSLRAAPSLRTCLASADGFSLDPVACRAAERLLLIASLCNDAGVERRPDGSWQSHGSPSEGALLLAYHGLEKAPALSSYPRRATTPFTSARRMMSTVHATPDGRTLTAMKGSWEALAALAPSRPAPLAEAHERAAGRRLFAVAQQIDDGPVELLGMVALEDPLRRDAALAVASARNSGVRVMLVTGDHLSTATSVGKSIGLLAGGNVAVEASDLDYDQLDEVAVVARATHAQKEAIVDALQSAREVVAMTGDGVNDAPALKSADVGVAIGPDATDTAVEVSHVLVSDGRLLSLVDGIHLGRQLAASLRAAIVYLLAASFGTILVIALSMAADRELPLGPLQILWLNLVVHIFPALALATGGRSGIESRSPNEDLLTAQTWLEIVVRAAGVGVACLLAQLLAPAGVSDQQMQTVIFLTMALALVGQVFLAGVASPHEQWLRLRSAPIWVAVTVSLSLLALGAYVPGLRDALDLARASAQDWAVAAAWAGGAWAIGQVMSVVRYHRNLSG